MPLSLLLHLLARSVRNRSALEPSESGDQLLPVFYPSKGFQLRSPENTLPDFADDPVLHVIIQLICGWSRGCIAPLMNTPALSMRI